MEERWIKVRSESELTSGVCVKVTGCPCSRVHRIILFRLFTCRCGLCARPAEVSWVGMPMPHGAEALNASGTIRLGCLYRLSPEENAIARDERIAESVST